CNKAASTCVNKGGNGSTCTLGTECTSGFCVDSVCCESSCTSTCEACDVAPNLGKCVAVSGPPHGTRPACKDPAGVCGGKCDGSNRAACAYPSPTTACGSKCESGNETKSTCDGN